MNIREATQEDFESIWPIFHEIVSAGETYAYSTDTTKSEALKIWLTTPRKTFVFEDGGQILGDLLPKNESIRTGRSRL